MGLDSYWMINKKIKNLRFNPKLRLCGGLFSGNGQGSFRGKCYDSIINEITGVSLYQKYISANVIKEMAKDLSDTKWHKSFNKSFDITKREFRDLQRMFAKYAKVMNITLRGWW